MKKADVERLLSDPILLVPDELKQELCWYIKLTTQQYFNNGYFVNPESYKKLTIPDSSLFHMNSNADPDIVKLYKSFAWTCWTQYIQPIVQDNELKGFAFKGQSDKNGSLGFDIIAHMLHYPPIDWINANFLASDLKIPEQWLDLINKNSFGSSRSIYREYKAEAARLYAILFLLDNLLFVARSYTDTFDNKIIGVTRSPAVLKSLVPTQADELIQALNNGNNFTAPKTGIIPCIQLQATTTSAVEIEYTGTYVELNLNDKNLSLLPFFQLKAYCDGFSQRINDMPNKATRFTIELQKTGESIRYATLNHQVFRQVYTGNDLIRVNIRARFNVGLDIVDYSFKYWNLQSSINAERLYSAFSPFSLRSAELCDVQKLSRDVLTTHYDSIIALFSDTVNASDDKKLASLAVACGINPQRPALRLLLQDFGAKSHPTELYMIIKKNVNLFR